MPEHNRVDHGFVTRFDAIMQTFIFRKKDPETDSTNYGYGPSNRIAPAEELGNNVAAWEKRKNRKQQSDFEKYSAKISKSLSLSDDQTV